MKIHIIGEGSFGTFLNELLDPLFEIDKTADSLILAVPISAYGFSPPMTTLPSGPPA